MDESEKLTALKKAYAEIILNTAKEAAARIVVSERKALRFQRELFTAKDEAFRMLLRLKQMLDSKAGEAKMMSLSQQEKIDELEAQLQEAEDIVKELREELSEVQAQLEKARSNPRQPDGQNLESDTAARGSITSQLNLQLDAIATQETNSISNGTYERKGCYGGNDSLKDNYYVQNPDFASLVMRSKDPELYRNGCTQRIRAFERNLLDEKFSLSGLVDDGKNVTLIGGDDEQLCKTPKINGDNTNGVEENLEELKVMQADGCHIQAPAFTSFQKKRRRAARFRRSKAPSCRYLDPHQLMEMRQVSDLSCTRTSASSLNNSVLADNASKKSEDEIQKVTSSISTSKILPDKTETSTQSECGNVTENDSVHKATNNDKTFIEESRLTGQECICAESLKVLACKTDVEKDYPLDKSDTKVSDLDDGTASQPENNKFLKYTFCRKRKKDTLSNPESKSLLDNDTLERNTGEEQNGSIEPQKSSLLIESSRESRRLAQVARQLISLSEKKWR
ncbi:uncharacterized protein LOC125467968 [Pyrus x bretschneideri]|uniref:uncharacterized protein LOC125467968 n=1 Tax=Pyrus x bretschneideri TaxID=225117 RepID=UPI002030C633|nr:uncharacterized protein LOC125467968 [Pyrus x bretschneideri]